MFDTMHRRPLVGLVAAGLFTLVATGTAAAKGPEVAANDGLNSTYWTQVSVEYKANAYGQFALAQMRLDQALADKSWTALPGEQAAGYESLPTAVILDIDETVLDNSPYQAWVVKTNGHYSSKTWTPFVESETSRAIPGSLEFIKYAASKGVAIYYISNRKAHEEKATIGNLKKLGYPVADDGSNVLVRGEKEEWKSSAKSPRRSAVGATHRVLLNIGDNLGDFTDESKGTPADRMAVYTKNQAMWGKQWIMIANPTYGSWEGAAIDNNWKASNSEKRQMKLDKMDAWKGPE